MAINPIDWAQEEAKRLRKLAESEDTTLGSTGPGLEFLRIQAGPSSGFFRRATSIVDGEFSAYYQATSLADLLEGWADSAAAGMTSAAPFEARARVAASTDLMEQVAQLLDNQSVHVAAPVLLAGAALEEFLRSLIAQHGITFNRKPGIAAYAEELVRAEVLTSQDIKDITAWAGQRNDAAHGHFESLTIDRARIMVDGINLFMRQRTSSSP